MHEEEEAPLTYTYLIEILESNPQILLNSKPRNTNDNNEGRGGLSKVVSVLTEVLATDLLSTELSTKVVGTLKSMMANVDSNEQATLWQTIPIEYQRILKSKGYF